MPSKKPLKRRLMVKHKGIGFGGFDKRTTEPLPDTSRIPWFQPIPKTGTDA